MHTTNLKKYKIEEVALALKVSVNTVNSWYRFKKYYPEDEFAKMLPVYTREGGERGIRYWTSEDIKQLKQFKKKRPTGRRGVMGRVTQKYVKPPRKEE